MPLPFEITWNRMKKQLKEGQSVKYWGKARGYSGKTFKLIKITNDYVVCVPPNAMNVQKTPKKDFEKI